MKESKPLRIVLFILLALPIPFSLLSWIGTIISVASIGMVDWNIFSELIQTLAMLIVMILAGTYTITYIISLLITLKKKRISLISFFPLLHIILFGIALAFVAILNAVYL